MERDGVLVERAALGTAVPLDPGAHTIVVNKAQVVVARMELERVGATCASDAAAGLVLSEQAASAGGRMCATAGHWHRRQTAFRAHAIQRARQVACGVGERAVQIEQHRVDWQRARRGARGVSRHVARRNRVCGKRRGS